MWLPLEHNWCDWCNGPNGPNRHTGYDRVRLISLSVILCLSKNWNVNRLIGPLISINNKTKEKMSQSDLSTYLDALLVRMAREREFRERNPVHWTLIGNTIVSACCYPCGAVLTPAGNCPQGDNCCHVRQTCDCHGTTPMDCSTHWFFYQKVEIWIAWLAP